MSPQTDSGELIEQIYGYGVAVITAMLMIFLAYKVLETLVGQLPAQVGGLLISLVGLYSVVVNWKIRKVLLKWLRGGRCLNHGRALIPTSNEKKRVSS